MVIDAHHHFWRYTPEDYGWIDESMSAIRRDFGPSDLQAEIAAAGVDGVVSVQARQSLAETEWLLDLASKHAFIRGVVGWVPLCDAAIDAVLERYAGNPLLCGVRHVLQDEPDDGFMLRPEFRRGLEAVQRHKLVYDILIFPRHLKNASKLVDLFPEHPFVLDHVAKPNLRTGGLDAWAAGVRELARRPNVSCKISGMVTEADHARWTEAQIATAFDVVLDAFGPQRLLFGSDWPVCLLAAKYKRWVDVVRSLIAPLGAAERAGILGENAARIYQLRFS